MHQGNWTCSKCGGAITELPFEPRRTDGLMCRECHQKDKGGERRERPRGDRGDRPMFEGNWKCADCGAAITKLPFEPRDTSNLKCKDCFSKSRG